MLWHGAAGLSRHWPVGTGGIASPRAVSDRGTGAEPSSGGRDRWRAAADGQHLAQAPSRAGRGGRAGRPASVAAARQGAVDGRGGRQDPRLDPRPDPRPAQAAVRVVDQPGGARSDRAAGRQDARPVDGAALFAALGHDPAKALGARQGTVAYGGCGLAGAALPGDRQAREGRGGPRSTGATRPESPIKTRSGGPTRLGARRPWRFGRPSGSLRA